LAAEGLANAVQIVVVDASLFEVGDKIIVSRGLEREELRIVVAVEYSTAKGMKRRRRAEGTLTLDAPLDNYHPAGASVEITATTTSTATTTTIPRKRRKKKSDDNTLLYFMIVGAAILAFSVVCCCFGMQPGSSPRKSKKSPSSAQAYYAVSGARF
jgi:hypothetical protein